MRLMGNFGSEFAGEMLAEQAGLFKAQGLSVTLSEGVDAAAAIEAVLSDLDAIGATRADSFLIARSKGVDVWPGHLGEEDYALTRLGVD
jgi:ABC-type nitrate/sulfonate/bicarbonate transport system substrate-binding protein